MSPWNPGSPWNPRLAGMSLCQGRNKKGLQSTDRLTQERYQAHSTIDFTGENYPLSLPFRLGDEWLVGTTGMEAFLKARGKANQPPTTGWQFYNCSTHKYEEDGSLTCNNFIASTPCSLTLSLNGRAKEVQGKCEGVYESTGLVSMGREVREIL